jgi:RNA-directed DNA polymerase
MVKEMRTKRIEKSKFKGRGSGRNLQDKPIEASNTRVTKANSDLDMTQLMERVIERENMTKALLKVERNKGSAGIDEMPTTALRTHLKTAWPKIKEQLLDGSYKPKPGTKSSV